MKKLNLIQNNILLSLLKTENAQSSQIYNFLKQSGDDISLVTVKRNLSNMTADGLLSAFGQGRSRSYHITSLGRIVVNVAAKEYCGVEPDKRYGSAKFNFELFGSFPKDIFLDTEINFLEGATAEYKNRSRGITSTVQKKELERLVIELSWKSSKIEGNTYSLLDTEKLISENKEASGHNKSEARMILNHKVAFAYIHKHREKFKMLSKKNLQDLHAILVSDLRVKTGFRAKPVGITGSKYQPLDNIYQITEAVEQLAKAINKMPSPYARALVALLGISYIQPFEDGNKRTSRLMANALLLAHKLAPMSYRSLDENEYRNAMFVFYEINSIVPFKKIFIEQYDFAARNYAVK